MKLEKTSHKRKIIDNELHYVTEYNLGRYAVSKYGTQTPEYEIVRIEIRKKDYNDRFLPDIYFYDETFGNNEKSFAIQTTSYGALKADEIKKVIAGYQEAIEAVEILTKEFINKTERG